MEPFSEITELFVTDTACSVLSSASAPYLILSCFDNFASPVTMLLFHSCCFLWCERLGDQFRRAI